MTQLPMWLRRRQFQRLWDLAHAASLQGMNFGGGWDVNVSGEDRFLRSFLAPGDVVLDVGANRGLYSRAALAASAGVTVHAFEPSSAMFAELSQELAPHERAHCWHLALSDRHGTFELTWPKGHDGLASVHRRDLRIVGLEVDQAEMVQATTLDDWAAENEVDHISLLKIDVEGGELAVLRGAAETMERGAIDRIQFEFGGTHIDARTFLREFFDLLSPAYTIHRMLPSGLSPAVRYSERQEIFVLQNYVALRT